MALDLCMGRGMAAFIETLHVYISSQEAPLTSGASYLHFSISGLCVPNTFRFKSKYIIITTVVTIAGEDFARQDAAV